MVSCRRAPSFDPWCHVKCLLLQGICFNNGGTARPYLKKCGHIFLNNGGLGAQISPSPGTLAALKHCVRTGFEHHGLIFLFGGMSGLRANKISPPLVTLAALKHCVRTGFEHHGHIPLFC